MSFGQLSISTKELYQGFKNIIPHRLAHGPNQTSTHKNTVIHITKTPVPLSDLELLNAFLP